MNKRPYLGAATVALMLLGGCGGASSGAAPDVRSAKSIAETRTLFYNRGETSTLRRGENHVRRESVLPRQPFTTYDEFEDLAADHFEN